MTRPSSIVRFERLYLASFALGLLGWWLTWSDLAARLAHDPRTASFGWMLPAAFMLNVALTLIPWYAVARRALGWVRWIVATLTVLHLLVLLPGLLGAPFATTSLLGLLRVALELAAVTQLFAADALAWFGLGKQAAQPGDDREEVA